VGILLDLAIPLFIFLFSEITGQHGVNVILTIANKIMEWFLDFVLHLRIKMLPSGSHKRLRLFDI
jgi:hypothetical protein